ncbi:hypothetical protein ACOMHN_026804 [Nucella lapillus]
MALMSKVSSCALFFFLVIVDSWPATESKPVVMIPMPHTGQTMYHIKMAHQLVKLGHQVWLTMPDYLLAKGVLNTSRLNVIEYSTHENAEEATLHVLQNKHFIGDSDYFSEISQIMKGFCYILLKNASFFQVMKTISPKLIIIDDVFIKMLSIIPYRLGVPFAFIGSAYDPVAMRVPFSTAVTPITLFSFSDHMNFIERLKNSLVHLLTVTASIRQESYAVATYAPEMPYLPLDMLVARADLWLVEMDHILDYPRPSLPNVKLIGGTATGPAKPLLPKFRSFMDSAAQGVVIVSADSYILHLPRDSIDKLLQVLLQLPLKSVFRSNLTSPDPNKVLMSPWIPQNDLLGHPNTKVFFTHCGKNGQYEALYHAVPMVSSPLFAEQFYNAKRAQVKGFSETVDLKTTTAEEMLSTVMKVATDERYKQAIGKASELFRIEFGIPVERAAFWLDHVVKYGGAHMRSAGQNVSCYNFLGIDILTMSTMALLEIILLLSCCCSMFRKSLDNQDPRKKKE